MGVWNWISTWRDDRLILHDRRRSIDEAWEAYGRAKADFSEGYSNEDPALKFDTHLQTLDALQADIDKIETKRLIAMARYWEVPTPRKPYGERLVDSNWYWNKVHDDAYLSPEGKARLRREVYTEMDFRNRPVLSWAAIAISIVSLVVSVFKP